MNSYQGFIFFLFGLLFGGAIVGLGTFFIQNDVPRKYLKCETTDRKTKIGIMIDDSERLFTLEGQVIALDKIKTFTEYLIFAEWPHSGGTTTVDLDRLSGDLTIIEVGKQGVEESAQKFECNHVNQKF